MIYYVLQEKKKKNVWTNLLIQVKHSKQSKLPKLQLRKNLISKFNFVHKKIIRYLLAGTLHAPLCTYYCFFSCKYTLLFGIICEVPQIGWIDSAFWRLLDTSKPKIQLKNGLTDKVIIYICFICRWTRMTELRSWICQSWVSCYSRL